MFRMTARLAAISIGALVGLGLAFQPSDAQTPPAGGTVAFTGARIIDGTGKAPIAQGTIVVTNGRITAVGPSASVTVPAGATQINAAGKTIIPGLINAHGHVTDRRLLETAAAPAHDPDPRGLCRIRRDDDDQPRFFLARG